MDPLFEKSPELQKKLKKRAEEHNRRVYNTIIDPNFHPNVDLTGQVFGHLHVLYYAGRDTRKENIYMCHCDLCENDVYENANSMLHLNRKSCGCSKYRTDDSESKLYSVFLGMNNRCYKKYIKNYIIDVVKNMGITVNIEAKKRENYIQINLFSENSSILIGKNGRTMDALQYLIKNSIFNKTGFKINVILDVEDYKEKINKHLEYNVKKIAREVRKTGVDAKLDPMNSYERRIVHNAVNEIKGVSTISEGVEPNRYVVIKKDEQ